MEYGSMWHTCEEAAAGEREHFEGELGGIDTNAWIQSLSNYTAGLIEKFPLDREKIEHWYEVCATQFPIYWKYWKQHPDIQARTPLLQEEKFDVKYELPSGREVRLRGRWDSVDRIGDGIWLQENKTKGDIDEINIPHQLTFDLQTMLYVVALTQDTGIDRLENVKRWNGKDFSVPIKGVRYNVVRRPLSGGKGSIVRHKATKTKPEETRVDYYARLGRIIDGSEEGSPGPEFFFMRWNVSIHKEDIRRFKEKFLNPCLEQLCWWYDAEMVKLDRSPKSPDLKSIVYLIDSINYQMPFGVFNPLTEGGSTEVDEYLRSGSMLGLERATTVFPELENE
jgi:hypothetical protein